MQADFLCAIASIHSITIAVQLVRVDQNIDIVGRCSDKRFRIDSQAIEANDMRVA